MKVYSLDLDFVIDKGSTFVYPIAAVCVSAFTRRTPDGPPIITPDCTTIEELDSEIDRLKQELDKIRKRARARFTAEAKRQRAKTGQTR